MSSKDEVSQRLYRAAVVVLIPLQLFILSAPSSDAALAELLMMHSCTRVGCGKLTTITRLINVDIHDGAIKTAAGIMQCGSALATQERKRRRCFVVSNASFVWSSGTVSEWCRSREGEGSSLSDTQFYWG